MIDTNIEENSDHLIVNDTFIDLRSININDSRLFLDGIAYISGLSVREYSDIDYKLLLKGDTNHVLQLAKAHRPEITEQFSKDKNIFYDKCWFTTPSYEGVSIMGIPNGIYDLFIVISVRDQTRKLKIKADAGLEINPIDFTYSFNDSNKGIIINKLIINNKLKKNRFLNNFTKHTNEKIKIENSFKDSFNNELRVSGNAENCFIKIAGKDNLIDIDLKSNIKNITIDIIGDDCNIKIGQNVSLFGYIRLGYNCELTIGSNVSSTNGVYITCAESTKIIIGEDCMFATNNQIRTDDAHPIYDVKTGKRINFSRDIIVGSHVWVGYGANIFGGAKIGDGSVVGAFSFVNNIFPNNCVVAGTPARIVKRDIFWERSPLLLHSKEVTTYTKMEMGCKPYCKLTFD